MAEAANIVSQPNAAVNTARKLTNERVGRIAQDLSSQSDDMTTALQAVLAAIQAKPSA